MSCTCRFVHHNTIGRGNKTLVYGPKVEAKDDKLYVYIWIDNRLDDGSTPLKPEQMPERSRERTASGVYVREYLAKLHHPEDADSHRIHTGR